MRGCALAPFAGAVATLACGGDEVPHAELAAPCGEDGSAVQILPLATDEVVGSQTSDRTGLWRARFAE